MTANPPLTPPTDEELAELERLALAATPGPWNCFGQHLYHSHNQSLMWSEGGAACAIDRFEDALHIAANDPTMTLRLVAEIRRLRARP